MNLPSVTIGIATFNRPEYLTRALECIALQDYKNITVIVSDNCSPNSVNDQIVNSYQAKISNLIYIKQAKNIGAISNFNYVLSQAESDFFMWLADDDEIKDERYISSMVHTHLKVKNASTVVAKWELILGKNFSGKEMKTANFPQKSSLIRALKYIWKADDSFFYGLHRTKLLKKASFKGYFWPNQKEITNWAYVYLMDMVLSGPIVLCENENIKWVNHEYTEKQYLKKHSTIKSIFLYLTRRLNVYSLMLFKVINHFGLIFFPLFLVVIFMAYARDIIQAMYFKLNKVFGLFFK